ncbi:trypsin epsilon [Drosophila ananassae]|uniref:trypsin epsilon n=1 Tax=Drosophila ananassae TaxID=7217 RepID=UPI000177DBC3|nr:trypsin epsilon [Drosophila ananassae]
MAKSGIIFLLAVAEITAKQHISNLEAKIVGGEPLEIHEVPWQVALLENGSFGCGGIIYSDCVILTAAHCVYGKDEEFLSVRGGSAFRSSGGTVVVVKKTIVHQNYIHNPTVFKDSNDIAVLILKSPLPLDGKTMQLIQLSEVRTEPETPAVVSGWGKIFSSPVFGATKELMATVLKVQSPDRCKKAYDAWSTLFGVNLEIGKKWPDGLICASSTFSNVCNGNSGGPLVRMDSDFQYKLIGIVSRGSQCQGPDVFTDTLYYKEWIEHTVTKYNLNTFFRS